MEPTAIGRLMISCAGGASRTSNLQITIMTGRGNAMFSPGLYYEALTKEVTEIEERAKNRSGPDRVR